MDGITIQHISYLIFGIVFIFFFLKLLLGRRPPVWMVVGSLVGGAVILEMLGK